MRPIGAPWLGTLSLTTAAHPPRDGQRVPPLHGAERDSEAQNSAGLCLLLIPFSRSGYGDPESPDTPASSLRAAYNPTIRSPYLGKVCVLRSMCREGQKDKNYRHVVSPVFQSSREGGSPGISEGRGPRRGEALSWVPQRLAQSGSQPRPCSPTLVAPPLSLPPRPLLICMVLEGGRPGVTGPAALTGTAGRAGNTYPSPRSPSERVLQASAD